MVKTQMQKNKKNVIFPYSKRYCTNCDKETIFKYDRIIGHSACEECGFFGKSNNNWKGQIVAEKRI